MICVIMTYTMTAGLTRLHIQRASSKTSNNSVLGMHCACAVPAAGVIVDSMTSGKCQGDGDITPAWEMNCAAVGRILSFLKHANGSFEVKQYLKFKRIAGVLCA